jgi:hypothetical protein
MKLITILLGLVATVCSAQTLDSQKLTVIDRTHSGKGIYTEVLLPELLDPRFAETADFRIVDQKGEIALEWAKLSNDDRLRAANLIYHLTRAKNYFLNVLHSEEVKRLEQIVIRINIVNDWNRLAHWSHENSNPQYNTSHSIPAGVGKDLSGNPVTWKREIWFRPGKELSVKGILNHTAEDPLNPTIRQARDAVYPSQITAEVQNGFRYMFGKGFTADQFLSASTHQLSIVAAIEGVFLLMKQVNRALLPNSYYLDTAMVPEVIYHEFSHIALSDYLVPNASSPVGEGLADYFAADIAGTPKLATRLKQYARGFERNGKKKVPYSIDLENSNQSTSGFVLSFLLGLQDSKNGLGSEMTRKLVWNSRTRLTTYGSDIRSKLAHELRIACMTECEDAARDDLILLQYFDQRFSNR